jgi:hypothetical protein
MMFAHMGINTFWLLRLLREKCASSHDPEASLYFVHVHDMICIFVLLYFLRCTSNDIAAL